MYWKKQLIKVIDNIRNQILNRKINIVKLTLSAQSTQTPLLVLAIRSFDKINGDMTIITFTRAYITWSVKIRISVINFQVRTFHTTVTKSAGYTHRKVVSSQQVDKVELSNSWQFTQPLACIRPSYSYSDAKNRLSNVCIQTFVLCPSQFAFLYLS